MADEMIIVPQNEVTKYSQTTPHMDKVLESMAEKKRGRPKGANRFVINQSEKLLRSLQIALKIAPLNAYDSYYRLKRRDGTTIENSNIIHLITHALTPGRNIIGEEDFILWLKLADINPSSIVNEYIKSRLMENSIQSSRIQEPQMNTTHNFDFSTSSFQQKENPFQANLNNSVQSIQTQNETQYESPERVNRSTDSTDDEETDIDETNVGDAETVNPLSKFKKYDRAKYEYNIAGSQVKRTNNGVEPQKRKIIAARRIWTNHGNK